MYFNVSHPLIKIKLTLHRHYQLFKLIAVRVNNLILTELNPTFTHAADTSTALSKSQVYMTSPFLFGVGCLGMYCRQFWYIRDTLYQVWKSLNKIIVILDQFIYFLSSIKVYDNHIRYCLIWKLQIILYGNYKLYVCHFFKCIIFA